MNVTTHAPGTFCWVELATTDQAAARQFYEGLFAWTAQEFPVGPDETYSIMRRAGRDVGGLYAMRPAQRTQGLPTHWLSYVAVVSADESAARVVPAGGTLVTQPFDVGTNGRMAIAADPLGAMFALWEPKEHQGAGIAAETGAVAWTELGSTDVAAARAFYTKLFGWTWQEHPMPGMVYAVALAGTHRVGGLFPMTGDEWRGIPSHWMTYFEVDDCDERTRWATARGATVAVPPTDIPGIGRFAMLKDPQGGVFSIMKSAPRTA